LHDLYTRCHFSDVAVHLSATALLLLAVFGTLMHLLHRMERRDLRLAHVPGTIASAVSIGAQTNLGELLAGRQRTEDISSALRDKKFRIDVNTMQVVMEGEPGYENAATPGERRKSIFAMLQGQRKSTKPQPTSLVS
jgi:precorrin-2 methylase